MIMFAIGFFVAVLVLFWSALIVAARADEAARRLNDARRGPSKENGDTAAP
jgi:hypothetical protein